MADLNAQISRVAGQPASVRVGTVSSTTPFTVTVQGATFTDVGWLGTYLPSPGDSVILLGQSSASGADPASWVALGRPGPTPGINVLITKLRRNTAQSIPNSAFTAISWNGIVMDTMGGFPSGSSTAFTAPFDGIYEIAGHASFVTNATGQRQALFFHNGASTDTFVSMQAVATIGTRYALPNEFIELNAGDQIEMLQWQNSGAALDTESATGTRPTMTIRYLGQAA